MLRAGHTGSRPAQVPPERRHSLGTRPGGSSSETTLREDGCPACPLAPPPPPDSRDFNSMRRFEASPRRTTPKGHTTFINCTAPPSPGPTYIAPTPAFVAHFWLRASHQTSSS